MKRNILLLFLIFGTIAAVAQINKEDKLSVDLDKDGIKDHVVFDKDNGVIIVNLSTQKFKSVKTKVLEFDPIVSRVRMTKSGFEYTNNWMRAGYGCQFRYDPLAKKIRLIGMSRFEFGPANNDGSGESSVNLLTNDYIGNWNYWDDDKKKLVAIPSIKRKMILPKVYFADFSDDIISDYTERCASIFEKEKSKLKSLKAKKN